MAWKLEGSYFENCSCEMPCPCIESGQPAHLTNIFHPAGSTLTIARVRGSKGSLFGIELGNHDKAGFSTHFSWAS